MQPFDIRENHINEYVYPDNPARETTMKHRFSGHTMVELLATLSIIAILVALAAPSFITFLSKNRATSYSNELSSIFNLARSEAIKRGQIVSVCSSADVLASTLTCSTASNPQSATDWIDGWLVFLDQGTIGTYETGDTLLKVGEPSSVNAVITTDSSDMFGNYVSFSGLGAPQGAGSLYICVGAKTGQSVGIPRTININTTGRLSITNLSSTGGASC
jgi:type IV fimbrial biogenesis protein FimT